MIRLVPLARITPSVMGQLFAAARDAAYLVPSATRGRSRPMTTATTDSSVFRDVVQQTFAHLSSNAWKLALSIQIAGMNLAAPLATVLEVWVSASRVSRRTLISAKARQNALVANAPIIAVSRARSKSAASSASTS